MKVLPSMFGYLAFVILLAIMPVAAQHNGYADWLVTNFWLIFFFPVGPDLFGAHYDPRCPAKK